MHGSLTWQVRRLQRASTDILRSCILHWEGQGRGKEGVMRTGGEREGQGRGNEDRRGKGGARKG